MRVATALLQMQTVRGFKRASRQAAKRAACGAKSVQTPGRPATRASSVSAPSLRLRRAALPPLSCSVRRQPMPNVATADKTDYSGSISVQHGTWQAAAPCTRRAAVLMHDTESTLRVPCDAPGHLPAQQCHGTRHDDAGPSQAPDKLAKPDTSLISSVAELSSMEAAAAPAPLQLETNLAPPAANQE
jgi:hypothetical protein